MPISHKTSSPQSFEPDMTAPILQIDRLSFAYSNGQQALQDISLSISPGEKVALVADGIRGEFINLIPLIFNR